MPAIPVLYWAGLALFAAVASGCGGAKDSVKTQRNAFDSGRSEEGMGTQGGTQPIAANPSDSSNVLRLSEIPSRWFEDKNPDKTANRYRLSFRPIARHFSLLSPDGSEGDLRRDEVLALENNTNWEQVRSAYRRIVELSRSTDHRMGLHMKNMTDQAFKKFYDGLYPGIDEVLYNRFMGSTSLGDRGIDQQLRKLNPNLSRVIYNHRFGAARVDCSRLPRDVTSCDNAAEKSAWADLIYRNLRFDHIQIQGMAQIPVFYSTCLTMDQGLRYCIGFRSALAYGE